MIMIMIIKIIIMIKINVGLRYRNYFEAVKTSMLNIYVFTFIYTGEMV